MADEKNKKEEAKKAVKETQLDSKLTKIIDQIAQLSVLELAELVKALEDKFGVQALAAAPAATPAPATGEAGSEAPGEEKSSFTLVLTDAGSNKIAVIKALREIKPDLGLKEAKDLTEKTPAEILTEVKKEQAEEAKKKLEEAGAKVELK